MTPLNKADILHHLSFKKPLTLHLFNQIDSTNLFLKNRPSTGTVHICCAEEQTHGRGRFGRSWYSPFGENIYFSARIPLGCEPSKLSGFGLMISLVVIKTLEDLGAFPLQVKWPNDVIWNQRKLSGCLVELVVNKSLIESEVVIGIGINVNSNSNQENSLDASWCSVYDIVGKQCDRNIIIARLIHHLDDAIQKFLIDGFSAFISEWQAVDSLYNHPITLYNASGPYQGIAKGVDQEGKLVLQDTQGELHLFSSGDTSQQKMHHPNV